MKTLITLSLLGCIATAGCAAPQGSARYVIKDADHGVIALPADNELNQAKAKKLMAIHFPDGFILGKQWEHEIGEDTNFSESSQGGIRQVSDQESEAKTSPIPSFFRQSGRTSGIQSTRKAKEWRIEYVRLKDPSLNAPSGNHARANTSESVNSNQKTAAPGIRDVAPDRQTAVPLRQSVVPVEPINTPIQEPIFPNVDFVPTQQVETPSVESRQIPTQQPAPQAGESNPFENLGRDEFEGNF